MLKLERRSLVGKSLGLMFQSKGFVFRKLDPDPVDPVDPDGGDEGGSNNPPPPPIPPGSGNQ